MASDTTRKNLIVGAFVLGGLLLFAMLILFVGGKGDVFQQNVTVRSRFQNIGGLLEGAPVRLNGVDIGQVNAVEFAEAWTQRPVVVTLEIRRSAAERIAKNARAEIRQLGVLGDKYVEIIQGNLQLGTVLETRYLEGEDIFDLSQIYEGVQEIIANVQTASAKVSEAVERFATPEVAADVAGTVDAIRNILEEIRTGEGFLHAMIYEEAHKGMLLDLKKTASNLQSASAYVRDLTEAVRQGKGSLHQLVYGDDLAVAAKDILKAAGEIRRLIEAARTGKGLVRRLFFEEQLATDVTEMMASLNAAGDDLEQVATQLREGKGTLGALIQDKALYEDLRVLLGGAARSKWLRSVIRTMIEQSEQKALQDQK